MNTTNHTSGEELKPCPFCGGAAELQEYEEVDATRWAALVRCTVCGVDGKRGYGNNRMGCFDAVNGLHKQSAIAGWNRRAQPTGEDAANGAVGEREASAYETLLQALGYPWLPCPICKGTEGCDHSVPERARAALTAEKVAAEPTDFVFPPMPPAIVMHDKLGPLFDRLSMHFYAYKCMTIADPQQPAQSAEQDEPAAYLVRGLDCHNEEYATVWIKRGNAEAAAAAIFRASITPLVEPRAAHTQSTATQPAQTQVALTDEQIWQSLKDIADRHSHPDDVVEAGRALLTAAQPVSGGKS
jgi:Lar family restriction alleviation protein